MGMFVDVTVHYPLPDYQVPGYFQSDQDTLLCNQIYYVDIDEQGEITRHDKKPLYFHDEFMWIYDFNGKILIENLIAFLLYFLDNQIIFARKLTHEEAIRILIFN